MFTTNDLNWGPYFEVLEKKKALQREFDKLPFTTTPTGVALKRRNELNELEGELNDELRAADPRPRIYVLEQEYENDCGFSYCPIGYFLSYEEAESERVRLGISPDVAVISTVQVGAIPDHP